MSDSRYIANISASNDGFDETLPAFVAVHQVLLDGGASCSEPDANGHDVAMLALKAADQNCVTCIQQRGGGRLQWQVRHWKFGIWRSQGLHGGRLWGWMLLFCFWDMEVHSFDVRLTKAWGSSKKHLEVQFRSVHVRNSSGIFFHA